MKFFLQHTDLTTGRSILVNAWGFTCMYCVHVYCYKFKSKTTFYSPLSFTLLHINCITVYAKIPKHVKPQYDINEDSAISVGASTFTTRKGTSFFEVKEKNYTYCIIVVCDVPYCELLLCVSSRQKFKFNPVCH